MVNDMEDIILELQTELMSSNCDIVNVLRKAHLIASKLKLVDLDNWIQSELNGYPNQKLCPEYRKMKGTLKAFNPYRGWIPVIIQNPKFEKKMCEIKIIESISQLLNLCELSKNELIIKYSGEQQSLLNEISNFPIPTRYALYIQTSSVKDIIEKVKNKILEWTLTVDLEGSIGENMILSYQEKDSTLDGSRTVNNYYAPINNVSIISGNNNTVVFSYERVKIAIDETKKSIKESKLSKKNLEIALELLDEIENKIEQKKSPYSLKSSFVGLKDFLISVGANVAAGLIQTKLQEFFY